MRNPFASSRAHEIGIDLGTSNTIVVAAETGALFDQPSVCCFQAFDAVPRFIAAGSMASSYVGKVAKPLKIVRPLKNGVLSDIAAARELLRYVQRNISTRRRWRSLRPLIGIPADATQSECRALVAAAVDAGFGHPELVPEPLLAAIGIGLNINEARGHMVIDCGGGTTEVAVISLGGICLSRSARGGGEALDQALIDHLSFHHRFRIGVAGAEALKLQLSQLLATNDVGQIVEIRGLDAASGLPRVLAQPASEFLRAWVRHVDQIVRVVRIALRETPPELSEDIFEDGIRLTGGGAVSALLAERIADSTGVKTHIANTPTRSVALGLQHVLERRIGAGVKAS